MDTLDTIYIEQTPDSYWSVRVVPAGGLPGFVGEVYNEFPVTIEVSDADLAPVTGQWLHAQVYRTMTIYQSADAARDAAERLRAFFAFAHLRG